MNIKMLLSSSDSRNDWEIRSCIRSCVVVYLLCLSEGRTQKVHHQPNAYLTWAECSGGSCNEKELDVNCQEVGGLENH